MATVYGSHLSKTADPSVYCTTPTHVPLLGHAYSHQMPAVPQSAAYSDTPCMLFQWASRSLYYITQFIHAKIDKCRAKAASIQAWSKADASAVTCCVYRCRHRSVCVVLWWHDQKRLFRHNCAHTHTHVHTNAHTHVHTHMHTYTYFRKGYIIQNTHMPLVPPPPHTHTA